MRLSGAGMRKMLFCCCEVHEAAGGPPAVCVMEARDGVGKTLFVYAMKQRRHVALGGLIVTAAGVCKRLDQAADPNPISTASTFLRQNRYRAIPTCIPASCNPSINKLPRNMPSYACEQSTIGVLMMPNSRLSFRLTWLLQDCDLP
jgi:hypothetical protein